MAEVHDATAVGEIIQIENLGLVARGEGGPASERGETRVGGRIPVNPSGGLESKGHPIARLDSHRAAVRYAFGGESALRRARKPEIMAALRTKCLAAMLAA